MVQDTAQAYKLKTRIIPGNSDRPWKTRIVDHINRNKYNVNN